MTMESICDVCRDDEYDNLTKDKEKTEITLHGDEDSSILVICGGHKEKLIVNQGENN